MSHGTGTKRHLFTFIAFVTMAVVMPACVYLIFGKDSASFLASMLITGGVLEAIDMWRGK